MINFTVGPVQMSDEIRTISSEQIPYFRTEEFSNIMLENEKHIKTLTYADSNSRVVFLTGSGSAAMEAAVVNVFTQQDKILILNGGTFGDRFVKLCKIHKIPYKEIIPSFGCDISKEDLAPYEGKDFTGFLINLNETSTGVLYNLSLIGEFCRRNHIFLIVDAISAFLADEISMEKNYVQVLLTGSQKALACAPGISILVLSEEAIERINNNPTNCMYLDLKSAIKDMKRGQTPFTPAVSILLQINARLRQIDRDGGILVEREKIAKLAQDFRCKIKNLPIDISSHSLSNSVTPLATRNCSAYDIFIALKNEYNIWICPNGGILKNKIFRVGHIGCLTYSDNTVLINALKDLSERKILC